MQIYDYVNVIVRFKACDDVVFVKGYLHAVLLCGIIPTNVPRVLIRTFYCNLLVQ